MANDQPSQLFQDAVTRMNAGDLKTATKLFSKFLKRQPDTPQAIQALSTLIAMARHDPKLGEPWSFPVKFPATAKLSLETILVAAYGLHDADKAAQALEWYKLAEAWPAQDPQTYNYYGHALQATGDEKGAYEKALKAISLGGGVQDYLLALDSGANIGISDEDYLGFAQPVLDAELTDARATAGTRGIFVAALPKSASSSLCKALSVSTGGVFPTDKLISRADGLLPNTKLLGPMLGRAIEAGAVVHAHAACTSENLQALAGAGVQKTIVTLRDPRQVMVSWFFHAAKGATWDRLRAEHDALKHIEPGSDAFKDWLLRVSFQVFLDWAHAWITQAEADPASIRLIEFADIVGQQTQTVQAVLDWLEIDAQAPKAIQKERFRSGRSNEWIDFFTAEQQAFMNDLLPAEWADRFGWAASSP